MGVPCVTLRGGGHAHNVGVSLMRVVGLEEDWVAGTEEEYIDMAVGAGDNLALHHSPHHIFSVLYALPAIHPHFLAPFTMPCRLSTPRTLPVGPSHVPRAPRGAIGPPLRPEAPHDGVPPM